ncbi:hypothetical protein CS369_17150 [Candidatus Symbiopectobacterium sp. 'North America']|nr:hypothetical protein [Candidatus Symbiopectobacterium sp. 'North America']
MSMSSEPVIGSSPAAKNGRIRVRGARLFNFLRLLAKNPLTAIGSLIVLSLIVIAIFAPWLATHDPLVQDLANALQAPGAAHWFGTDEFGRDV